MDKPKQNFNQKFKSAVSSTLNIRTREPILSVSISGSNSSDFLSGNRIRQASPHTIFNDRSNAINPSSQYEQYPVDTKISGRHTGAYKSSQEEYIIKTPEKKGCERNELEDCGGVRENLEKNYSTPSSEKDLLIEMAAKKSLKNVYLESVDSYQGLQEKHQKDIEKVKKLEEELNKEKEEKIKIIKELYHETNKIIRNEEKIESLENQLKDKDIKIQQATSLETELKCLRTRIKVNEVENAELARKLSELKEKNNKLNSESEANRKEIEVYWKLLEDEKDKFEREKFNHANDNTKHYEIVEKLKNELISVSNEFQNLNKCLKIYNENNNRIREHLFENLLSKENYNPLDPESITKHQEETLSHIIRMKKDIQNYKLMDSERTAAFQISDRYETRDELHNEKIPKLESEKLEMKILKNMQYRDEIENILKNNRIIEEENEDLKALIKELETSLAKVKSDYRESVASNDEIKKNLISERTNHDITVNELKEKLNAELKNLKGSTVFKDDLIKSLKDSLAKKKHQHISELKELKGNLSTKERKLKENIENSLTKVNKLKEENKGLKNEINSLVNRIELLNQTIEAKENDNKKLSFESSQLNEVIKNLESSIKEKNSDIDNSILRLKQELENKQKESEKELAKLKKKNAAKETKLLETLNKLKAEVDLCSKNNQEQEAHLATYRKSYISITEVLLNSSNNLSTKEFKYSNLKEISQSTSDILVLINTMKSDFEKISIEKDKLEFALSDLQSNEKHHFEKMTKIEEENLKMRLESEQMCVKLERDCSKILEMEKENEELNKKLVDQNKVIIDLDMNLSNFRKQLTEVSTLNEDTEKNLNLYKTKAEADSKALNETQTKLSAEIKEKNTIIESQSTRISELEKLRHENLFKTQQILDLKIIEQNLEKKLIRMEAELNQNRQETQSLKAGHTEKTRKLCETIDQLKDKHKYQSNEILKLKRIADDQNQELQKLAPYAKREEIMKLTQDYQLAQKSEMIYKSKIKEIEDELETVIMNYKLILSDRDEELQEAKNKISTSEDSLILRFSDFESKLNKTEAEKDQILSQNQKLEAQYTLLQKSHERCSDQILFIQKLSGDILTLEKRLKRCEKKKKNLEASLREALSENAELNNIINFLNQEIKDIKQREIEKEQELNISFKNKDLELKYIQDQLSLKENELTLLRTSCETEINSEIQELQALLSEKDNSYKILAQELQDIQSQYSNTIKEPNAATKKALEEMQNKFYAEMQVRENVLVSLKNEITHFKDIHFEAETRYLSQLKKLEIELKSMNNENYALKDKLKQIIIS